MTGVTILDKRRLVDQLNESVRI